MYEAFGGVLSSQTQKSIAGNCSLSLIRSNTSSSSIRHMTKNKSRSLPVIELLLTVGERGEIGRLARVLAKASQAGGRLSLLMCGLFFLASLSTCFAGD